MEWLVGYDCSCDAESLAMESMARAYQGSNWDIQRLSELRDPRKLGRIVRIYPVRFSVFTPKAHLKVWLSFADKKELRDQARAGARQLDHRIGDAIEMLTGKYDISAPWTALQYLPVPDLGRRRLCATLPRSRSLVKSRKLPDSNLTFHAPIASSRNDWVVAGNCQR
jgi:hypothetical protein